MLSGLKQIKNDYDTNVMYDIAKVAGKIQLFVSHHKIDLSTLLIPNDGSLEEAFAGASGTKITIVNDCGFTVWPGISSSPVLNVTGFELANGTSQDFQVPGNWSGSIWGRTGCTFDGSGHGSCVTGDCGGEMECNGRNYTKPVTIAELSVTKDYESYHVSIQNGFNIPMTVEPSPGDLNCQISGCVNDLNRRCPSELKLEGGGGCRSCQGSCANLEYSRLFEWACPRAIYDNAYWCWDADYTVRFCPPSNTFSTVRVDRQMTASSELFSNNGIFRLTIRFYDEPNISTLILFSNNEQMVWAATWSAPLNRTALSIDPNTGNLIITEERRIVFNITDVQAGPNPNVTATLEDNGNFRLINESNKRVLWESFDHPNNILLPGMKLGYDYTTGKNWSLISSISDFSPVQGAFTLSWEPTEQNLVIQRRGQPYWTS
nr:G-type lectin S-receptor-like serine/threonine-protein kinase At1g67520 [Tanacetum cinerariifolium]